MPKNYSAQSAAKKGTPGRLAAQGRLFNSVALTVSHCPRRTKANQSSNSAEQSSHRLQEQEWLAQHQAEYPGAWVALQGSELVAQGSSALQVIEDARSKGCERPLVVHISDEPESLSTPAPSAPANGCADDKPKKPLSERIRDLWADLPPDALAKLPTDGASQVDHYVYGLPKRSQ